jgi:hypothetical protein
MNVSALETERARLTRFWHYFKRRTLDQRIAEAQSTVTTANYTLTEARAAVEAIEKEPLPEFPGLLVETRRAINIAAIAYAEVLCVRLFKTQLVKLAREATSRREATDEYGTREECEALMAEIERARGLVQGRTNIVQEVKARSERIKQIARYRTPVDTSPMSDSLAFGEGDVMETEATGAGANRLPNVLGEDTWDLFRILLR